MSAPAEPSSGIKSVRKLGSVCIASESLVEGQSAAMKKKRFGNEGPRRRGTNSASVRHLLT